MSGAKRVTKDASKDMKALLERAIKEPGVAEAVEICERSESVYADISRIVEPPEAATDTTAE